MVIQEQFTISTRGHGDMHDLTDAVAEVVGRSGVRMPGTILAMAALNAILNGNDHGRTR
jgi:thiamine phosphate synthase YjbQ (UPF0047 family)